MGQLMQQMAQHGHIHDPQLWFLSADARAPHDLPPCVVKQDGRLWDGLRTDQVSFCVAVAVDPNAPASLTPILWTRGLQDDGTWRDGVYGSQGGFVAFLDGHVQWYKSLASGKKLLRYGHDEVTVNIREALPPGARVLPGG
jgi:prepilin-type processing-associated H-X9-DG protein